LKYPVWTSFMRKIATETRTLLIGCHIRINFVDSFL